MSPANVPAADPTLEEEAYISSEDEDFDPTNIKEVENESSDSASEDDAATSSALQKGQKPKIGRAKKKPGGQVEDLGFENSGDEITIKQGTKRKRKEKDVDVEDEDSGGDGGFVKTRSMRAVA